MSPWRHSGSKRGAPDAECAEACGGGGIYVLATSDMLARVPVERTSSAGGMAAAAQSLAHVAASPLIGAAIDRSGGYGSVLVALGLIVVPTSLAFVFWPGMNAGCASSTR